MSERHVTGSMLLDLVKCERRVHHDIHTDAALRDPVSGFVQMLWREGRGHEEAVLSELDGEVVDLRDLPRGERERATMVAVATGADLILGARLLAGDMLGEPDLLRRRGDAWIGGDVKSGGPFEQDGSTPRREYAAQVGHYGAILERLGLGPGDEALVIGRDGLEVSYDLRVPRGRAGVSIADAAAALADHARGIRDGTAVTTGATSAACKMCHWHTVCEAELEEVDDLTRLAGVGRSVRDALRPVAATVAGLAALDVAALAAAGTRTVVPGVGLGRLSRLAARARLVATGGAPYAFEHLGLARAPREIHFDIESDPGRDNLIYLHGMLDRRVTAAGETTEYVHFFADDEAGERDVFAAAMDYLTADPAVKIYYYSKYERTSFRMLQRRYPDVCTERAVEDLFDPTRAVDLLFDVIMPRTEWPLGSLSIKAVARYLGFDWRDGDAGGAASISWYDDYRRSGDPAIRRRIVEYNNDDVLASAAVLDGLIALPVRPDLGPL